jgi:Flp pilus assembly protein TadG
MHFVGAGRRPWRGQAVVEFAFTTLLLLTMVGGTIDLGRAVIARVMLANAVREAAHQGALTPSDTAAMVLAASQRSPTLALSTSSFTVSCSDWSGNARSCASGSTSPASVQLLDQIKVCASYTFNTATARLIGVRPLTFSECERANVQ